MPSPPSPSTTPTAAGRTRLEPLAAELRFGFSDSSAEVVLGGGRTLRFRGSIDRVDRAGDEQLVVTDYKYSSTRKYDDLTQENPTASGTLLQLPIYAVAARDRFDQGRLPLPVRARYAFARPDREGRLPPPKELEVDGALLDAWRDALEVIVAGIEQGHFPARPGEDLQPVHRLRRLPGVRSRRPGHHRPPAAVGAAGRVT